jgi:hypothetical protein
MKTKSANFSAHLAAWTTGVLILSSLALSPQAANGAPNSPAGAGPSFLWDCIISGGHQQGIAFLNFNTNFTFTGYSLESTTLHPTASTPPDPTVTRGGDGIGRNANDSTATVTGGAGKGVTNVFGFGPVSGPWTYDDKGRVVGFFTQALNSGGSTWPCVTNAQVFGVSNGVVVTTNLSFCFTGPTADIQVTFDASGPQTFHFQTNAIVGAAEITNSVSFVGTVVPNKHLTLTASTTLGKVTFNGVPFKTNLTDLTGSWVGYKKVNGVTDLQLFSLSSFVSNGIPTDTNFTFKVNDDITNFPNIYFSTNGTGPGYTFTGVSMLSQRKKIGFTFDSTSTGLSATYGSFTATRKLTNVVTKGVEEPTNIVNFKATWQSNP